MRRNLGTIDLDTGEILDGVPVYVHAKIKWREGWFMGIQDAFIALAKDKDINGGTRRVLDYMFGRLGFENYICIQQKEICEALDLQKSHVSSAVKLLLKKGIILPGPKLGRTSSYRLNPTYGWKGKVTNLSKTRLELIHSRQD
jgi:DNA-binding transcriptional regulator GbsR (MarR family)